MAAAASSQHTILLVEDEPDIRAYVAQQLRGLGYFVLEAGDAHSGRALLEQNPSISLLLTDVVLPHGVSGLALARQARELRPDLRVLLASGYSEQAFKEEGGTDLPLLKKPFRRRELADAVQQALLGTPALGGENQGPRQSRVLVVDDLSENRRFVNTILTRAGYRVGEASNGIEAIEALRTGFYDVVLMDAQMPEMDGLEATRRIRTLDEPLGRVVVIGVSAGSLPEEIEAMEAAGMDDHVVKPFRRAELLDKIASWGFGPAVQNESPSQPKPLRDEPDLVDQGFQDVVDLLGREAALAALERLRRQIEETFTEGAMADPVALARKAHSLVAQAGLLGFKELSDLSSALERACLGHGDLSRAFAAAASSARAALVRAEGLSSSGA